MKIGVNQILNYEVLTTDGGDPILTEDGEHIGVPVFASYPIRIPIKKVCKGYHLRWYYNGWHYWFFLPGETNMITTGEEYRTLGTRKITMSSGQVVYSQAQAIRTILNTREVYILTTDGWKNIRVDAGRVVTYKNHINGYEIEITTTIGSKEISKDTGYTPVTAPTTYPYDSFVIITILNGTFTITITTIEDVTITFNWGDGTTTDVVFVAGVPQEVTHVYNNPDNDEYTIYINNAHTVVVLDASDNDIIFFLVPETAINLTDLDLSGNLIEEGNLVIPEELAPNINVNTDGNPMSSCDIVIGTQIWQCKNYDSQYPGFQVYDWLIENKEDYGCLYNPNMVKANGFTANNWVVPSYDDWDELITYLLGLAVAGGELKDLGTEFWNAPNTGALDTYGFSAQGGGKGYLRTSRFEPGLATFSELKVNGYFWTKTPGVDGTYYVEMNYSNGAITVGMGRVTDFFSVRLIRSYKYLVLYPSFNDWFLPSMDELNEMYTNLHLFGLGNFELVLWYWTSYENDANTAWIQSFATGAQGFALKVNTGYVIRACRSFVDLVGAYALRDTGPAGGLIFYIDGAGTTYYETPLTDTFSTLAWSNITASAVTGTGAAIGTGDNNSDLIIAQVGHITSAAKLCKDYES